MKKALLLTVLLAFTGLNSFSQSTDQCEISTLMLAGGSNFQIMGEGSNNMVDALFLKLPNTKRKGYIWKFKDVQIPGIETPITFQVHQGLAVRENGAGYFNTFTSEKYKAERLAHKKDIEQAAIIIYVKQGRNFILKSEEEAKIVREYLLSICG